MDMNMDLYDKLVKLQGLMHRKHFQEHISCGPAGNPARGQGRILSLLKMKDGISTKDIAYMLDIRVSSLNELLAKLEKNGYITREQSETDKRVVLNKITEKGKEQMETKADTFDAFGCFSQEECTVFGEFLDRMILNLEKEMSEDENETYEDHCRRRREAFERFGQMNGFHDFHEFGGPRPPRHPHGPEHDIRE